MCWLMAIWNIANFLDFFYLFIWHLFLIPILCWGFPCGLAGKESICNVGDLGSSPELGRFPGEGKGYPLQYSSLENSMDFIVHGVTKSQTWMSDFHFTSWLVYRSWLCYPHPCFYEFYGDVDKTTLMCWCWKDLVASTQTLKSEFMNLNSLY